LHSTSDRQTTSRNQFLGWLGGPWTGLAALILAASAFGRAQTLSWLSDDSFASFRYADNWARGIGLVFNAKERVEGITNPLWTVILGLLARAGFNIEKSSIVLGLVAYLLCVVLLTLAGRRFARGSAIAKQIVPIAAIIAVADTDLATFATGGLETSLFSTSVLASFVFAWWSPNLVAAGTVAGILASITGMLRPDGALFVPALALSFWGSRRRGLWPYLATCCSLLVVFHGWRRIYYGNWMPNTYYAKSAFQSWWSQGLTYFGYFARRQAALILVALSAATIAIIRMPRQPQSTIHKDEHQGSSIGIQREQFWRLFVAWAMILVYTLSVVRVGGDFMYARLLVPIIPLLALAAELSLTLVIPTRPKLLGALGIGTGVATLVAPCPVDTDIASHSGIVDERAYYQLGFADFIERNAGQLHGCIAGYPVRAAIYGGELRLAYRARFPYAIEAHAGLTDSTTAHRPLTSRQRVGHEKSADARYLVLTQKAHFATSPLYAILSDPNGFIPDIHADLCGVDVRLLHWDPAFVEYVKLRGAHVPDYPAWLDRVMARLDYMPDDWVRRQLEQARHFYFLHVTDPERERVFATRLRMTQQ
jgi:hypothetical protein